MRDRRSAARGPDARLPRAARGEPPGQHPDSSLFDRLAGVAHRLRAARSDDARLPQHHAARVLRRRPRAARPVCASRTARADGLPPRACDLALGDSEFNRQELEALGFRADRRAAGRARLLASRRRARTTCSPRQFDDDWTNILFVGRVIPNKRIEDLIRFFHAYKTRIQSALAPADRRVVRRLRDVSARCCSSSSPAELPDVHFTGHVTDEELSGVLRRRRSLPVRERARRLLRAAGRGVLQAGAGRGLCRDGRAGDDGRRRRAVSDAQDPRRRWRR